MYVILYFDPCIYVFASWSTPSHTSTKLNLSVYDPVSYKEINWLPLHVRLFSEWLKTHLGLKNLLSDSILFKSQNVMANGYYGTELYFSSYESLRSKATGNSDSQRLQKIPILKELR